MEQQKKDTFKASIFTDPGQKRNDDSHLLREYKKVFAAVVADGVGGTARGDIASQYIVRSLGEWFDDILPDLGSMDMAVIHDEMKYEAQKIHEELLDIVDERGESMASTLTFALIGVKDYAILQVGDSRAYLYDCNKRWVSKITKDQTVREHEKATGEKIDYVEEDRKDSTLMQCLGHKDISPEYYTGGLPDNFDILLCSDGLSNTLTEMDIKKELSKNVSGKTAIKRLARIARERGEDDNITAILIRRRVG